MMRCLSLAVMVIVGCGAPAPHQFVVVYSAQDPKPAEMAFAEFTKAANLGVRPKFDSEAAKSFGLVRALELERTNPRSDVHWNNEILGTIRLARQGVYARYASPSAADYPASSRGQDDRWTAFAARARVLIVNTDKVAPDDRPKNLIDLTDPKWKGRLVMAKPLFGTTATHAAALFSHWGDERAKEFYSALQTNAIRIVPGNKQVAEAVGRGEADVGMTDTDDAIDEVKAGNKVVIIAPDSGADGMGTLFIPNTVALVANGPNPEGGKRLIDFLLSRSTEELLAATGGHQIPLNPKAAATLPRELEAIRGAKPMPVDWFKAADSFDRAMVFLKERFAR